MCSLQRKGRNEGRAIACDQLPVAAATRERDLSQCHSAERKERGDIPAPSFLLQVNLSLSLSPSSRETRVTLSLSVCDAERVSMIAFVSAFA